MNAAERPRRRFRFLRPCWQRLADRRSTGPSLSETAAGVITGLSLLTERNRGGHDRDADLTNMVLDWARRGIAHIHVVRANLE